MASGDPAPLTVRQFGDPAPLTVRQLWAVGHGATRELAWGLHTVSHELQEWRRRAHAIPDATIRHDAIAAHADKRLLIDGAALFCILPRRRNLDLLRLLVAFQTLANFLDNVSERAARSPGRARPPAVLPLLIALDLEREPNLKPTWLDGDDGGYVGSLAEACRTGCSLLPHYPAARPLLLREAHRARSLDIEHEPNPHRRRARMKRFAGREAPAEIDATWWEVVAGGSSLLTVIVLLAVAAEPSTTEDDLQRAAEAYRWASRAGAMLDSYVDQREDATTGSHNYLNYYQDADAATQRVAQLVERSVREASALARSEHHLLIVTSMLAMYLSSDSARAMMQRSNTTILAARAGTLTRLLVPILRAFRMAHNSTRQ
jgi:tetraprenyl-beta-curcumene synthase